MDVMHTWVRYGLQTLVLTVALWAGVPAERTHAAVISDIIDISSTPGVLVTDLTTNMPAEKTIDDSPPGSPNNEPRNFVILVVANPSAGRAFDNTTVALLEDDGTVSDLITTHYFAVSNTFSIELTSDANESVGGPGLPKPPPGPDTAFINELTGDFLHQPVRGFLDIPDLIFKTNGVPQNVGLIVSVRSDTERINGLPETNSLLLLAVGLLSFAASRRYGGKRS